MEYICILEALLEKAQNLPNVGMIEAAQPLRFDTQGNLW
jgi:hypothetical protein